MNEKEMTAYLIETEKWLTLAQCRALATTLYKWCVLKAAHPEKRIFIRVAGLDVPSQLLLNLSWTKHLLVYRKTGNQYRIQDTLSCPESILLYRTYLAPNPELVGKLVIHVAAELLREAITKQVLGRFAELVAEEAGKVGVFEVEAVILESTQRYSFHFTKGQATVVVSDAGATIHVEPLDIYMATLGSHHNSQHLLSINWTELIERAKGGI